MGAGQGPRDGLRQRRRPAALRQQLDAISVGRLDRERKNTKNVDVATRWEVNLSLRIFLAGFNGTNVQGIDFEQRASSWS